MTDRNSDFHKKLQIIALKKALIVLSELGKQLGKNDKQAEQETKTLGCAIIWAIEELEEKYGKLQ